MSYRFYRPQVNRATPPSTWHTREKCVGRKCVDEAQARRFFTRLMTPHIMQHWFGFEQLVLTKAQDAQSQDAIVRFGPMGAPCSPRGGQGGERACHTAPPSRCRSPAYCSRSCRRAPHHRTLPDRRRPHPSFSYLPIFLSTKEANP